MPRKFFKSSCRLVIWSWWWSINRNLIQHRFLDSQGSSLLSLHIENVASLKLNSQKEKKIPIDCNVLFCVQLVCFCFSISLILKFWEISPPHQKETMLALFETKSFLNLSIILDPRPPIQSLFSYILCEVLRPKKKRNSQV